MNTNNSNEKLTIEELRAFPGCEHYTDEEAKSTIETLYQISVTLYKSRTSINEGNNFINLKR